MASKSKLYATGLILALISFIDSVVEPARADHGGTLAQWRASDPVEGGPDLSEPLVTDRPDFTEASVTVGQGVTQIEFGYTYAYDAGRNVGAAQHSYPETLLRVGMLADWFEMRLDWNYGVERENFFDTSANSNDGAEDLGIGCKIALTPQDEMLPETAIIVSLSVPTGEDRFTAGQVLPGGSFLYGWDITDDWSTGGSSVFNGAVDDEAGTNYFEFAQSWTVGRSWTEAVGSYAEWFAFIPSGADTNHTEHYFNGGITYLFNNNVQWDVRVGVGLNDAADDYFVGTGLSLRMF